MSSLLKVLLCSFLCIYLFIGSVFAEESLDDIRQRLSSIERQMIRFKSNSLDASSSSPSQTVQGLKSHQIQGDLTGNLASDFEIRISALQEDMQRLTGQFERNNHLIAQAQEKLEILNSDLDLRMADMEKRTQELEKWQIQNRDKLAELKREAQSARPPKEEIIEHVDLTSSAKKSPLNETPKANLSPETLIPTPKIAPKSLPQKATSQAVEPPTSQPENLEPNHRDQSSSELYETAFSYLRKPDYPAAEKGFLKFITEFPEDNLAPNAQYWLAETYYARGQFEQAVSAFAEGYKKFPNHAKAMDNLVKLGLSFSSLKKNTEACVTFAQFDKKFPKAPISVAKRVKGEAEKIGCATPIEQR